MKPVELCVLEYQYLDQIPSSLLGPDFHVNIAESNTTSARLHNSLSTLSGSSCIDFESTTMGVIPSLLK